MSYVLFRVYYARKTKNSEARLRRLVEHLRKRVPELDPEWVQPAPFFKEPELGVMVRLPEWNNEAVLERLRTTLEQRRVQFEERMLVEDDFGFPWVESPGHYPERDEIERKVEAGKAFSHMGMLDDAKGELEAALEMDPHCTEAYHYLIAILRQVGPLTDAEKWVRVGVRHHNSSASFHFLTATVLEDLGKLEEALTYIKTAVRLDPDSGAAYVAMGRILHALGRKDGARLAYEEALSKELEVGEAALGLGSLTLEDGRLDDSMDWLLRAIAADPECVEARLKLGWCYLHSGQQEQAEMEFLQVANGPRTEFHLSARFSLGRLYLLLGNFSLAQEVLAEVVEMQPELGDAHRYLAEAYSGIGDFASSATHWRHALVYCPEAEFAIKPHLALVLTRLGEYDEAEDHLRELLEEQGGRADVLELMATIAMARDEWVEARSYLSEAATLDPESAMIAFQQGWADENLGRTEEARAFYNRAIRLEPDLYEAYSGLGWSYYEEGEYEVALVLFEKALELCPGNPEFMDHLGWVHLLLEQHQQALELFDKALKLEPESSFYRSHRGAALFHLGHLREARTEIERVLAETDEPMIDSFARYLQALVNRAEGRREFSRREFDRLRSSEELPPEFVALTTGTRLSSKKTPWRGRRQTAKDPISSAVGD